MYVSEEKEKKRVSRLQNLDSFVSFFQRFRLHGWLNGIRGKINESLFSHFAHHIVCLFYHWRQAPSLYKWHWKVNFNEKNFDSRQLKDGEYL